MDYIEKNGVEKEVENASEETAAGAETDADAKAEADAEDAE